MSGEPTGSPPQPKTIRALADTVPQALAMLAAMELDIFTALGAGPLTTEQIAQKLGVRPDKLQSVLAVLVMARLLDGGSGGFSNSAEADTFLVRGRPGYMGSVYELWGDMWRAELETAESVRTGIPQAKHDFTAMSASELEAFVRGSHSGSISAARLLMAVRDLSAHRMLLDVGGGSGGLAIELTRALPLLRATVIELPAVAPLTKQFVSAAGANARVEVRAGDAAGEPLNCQGDVAVCNRFIQVLAPEEARRAVANIGVALAPGGWLHIIGHVLDDSGLTPPRAVAYGLLALNMYDGGQAFTEQQHREWLLESGFVEIERTHLPDGYELMSARKPV